MRRLLLAGAVLVSAGRPQAATTPEFEVASVKPVERPVGPHAVSLIINHIDSDLYDIAAKAASADVTRDQIRAMLQSLLIARFKLAVHRETKELPEYTLSPWKTGPKLTPATDAEKPGVSSDGSSGGGRRIAFQKMGMTTLVNTLANMLGNPVIDKTGVTGLYDYTLEWVDAGAPLDNGPSLFVALQEQLGLKLEVKKVPIEVLVIDHIEKASAN